MYFVEKVKAGCQTIENHKVLLKDPVSLGFLDTLFVV